MPDGCDNDAPQYKELSSRTYVARKQHICAACKEPIEPGTKYWRLAYLLDGKFFTEAHHPYLCGVLADDRRLAKGPLPTPSPQAGPPAKP